MGTWAAGNFDNDAAGDVRSDVAKLLDTEINSFAKSKDPEVEELEMIMACIDMKLALMTRCHLGPPPAAEAKSLRKQILDLFDSDFEQLDPSEEFMEERRKVVADTLDEFVRVSEVG